MKINFPHLLAEFVVVVVGVAIALAADSWRENLDEIGLEAEYLTRISSDLELGRSIIEENQERDIRVLNASRQFLNLLDMPDTTDKEILETFFQAGQLRSNQSNQRHDVTYQELISTGRFSLLRDTNLRQKIAEYYRSHQFMMDQRADRNLYSSIVLRQITAARETSFIVGDAILTESQAMELVSEIRNNEQLVKSIRENVPSIEFSLMRTDATLELNSEVQNLINAY